jgi:hypothetical protein
MAFRVPQVSSSDFRNILTAMLIVEQMRLSTKSTFSVASPALDS